MRNASNISSRTVSSAEGYIGPSCASPARDDQQRCLPGYLASPTSCSTATYQALILRLSASPRRRDGAPAPPVVRLRTAQRNWLVYRDEECRSRNARSRGSALGTDAREVPLGVLRAARAGADDALTQAQGDQAKREQPPKSKRPKRSQVHAPAQLARQIAPPCRSERRSSIVRRSRRRHHRSDLLVRILVLNVGSSTLKFQLVDTDGDAIAEARDRRLARGQIERIGGEAIVTLRAPTGPVVEDDARRFATTPPPSSTSSPG